MTMLSLQQSMKSAMRSRRGLQLATTVMASLMLSSCASTQLSDTWRDSSYREGPLKKMLVVAFRDSPLKRRAYEDGFVAAMSSHAVDVTPSYLLFGGTLPDTGLIKFAAKEQGFDGIILVGHGSSVITSSVTDGYDVTSPESASHPWSGWSYTYFDREYYPGYPVLEETVKDQVKVWTTRGEGRMIWAGECEVHLGGSQEDVTGGIIHLVVPALVKQGIIAGISDHHGEIP